MSETTGSPSWWPKTHDGVVREAVLFHTTWPKQLESGVMFYMGERITREEFNRWLRALKACIL